MGHSHPRLAATIRLGKTRARAGRGAFYRVPPTAGGDVWYLPAACASLFSWPVSY